MRSFFTIIIAFTIFCESNPMGKKKIRSSANNKRSKDTHRSEPKSTTNERTVLGVSVLPCCKTRERISGVIFDLSWFHIPWPFLPLPVCLIIVEYSIGSNGVCKVGRYVTPPTNINVVGRKHWKHSLIGRHWWNFHQIRAIQIGHFERKVCPFLHDSISNSISAEWQCLLVVEGCRHNSLIVSK